MQFSWAVVREESEKQYAGSNSRTQYWEWTTAGHRAVFPSEMWIFTLHGSLAFPLRDPRPLSCLFMREHFLTFLWCVQATTCLRMLSTIYSLWFDTTVVEYLNKTLFFFSKVILASVACVCLWCVWVLAFDAVCPLSVGMWLFCPGVFLVHTRELPFLELRLKTTSLFL